MEEIVINKAHENIFFIVQKLAIHFKEIVNFYPIKSGAIRFSINGCLFDVDNYILKNYSEDKINELVDKFLKEVKNG